MEQSALDERKPAVEFQLTDRPPVRGQLQGVEIGAAEHALVGEIVNREQAGGTPGLARQERRDQRGLPVVAMNQVGAPVQPGTVHRQFAHGAAEDAEAQCIVLPVGAVGLAVRAARPVEQGRGVDQVQRHCRPGHCACQNADRLIGAGQVERGDFGKLARVPDRRRVGGQNEAYFLLQFTDGRGQAARHVGQPAGLDQRVGLAAREQDIHAVVWSEWLPWWVGAKPE